MKALIVVLDHCQLLGCVQRQVVVGAVVSSTAFAFQIWKAKNKIFTFDEAVLFDAVFDPVCELLSGQQKGVQVAGVAKLGGLILQGSGKNRNEGGGIHGENSFTVWLNRPP
jgi:hypothetical protein